MSIKESGLYQEMQRSVARIPVPPSGLFTAFEQLCEVIRDQEKYIALVFPEYTPHDAKHHLDKLFVLADRVLGKALYSGLAPSEVIILGFALYSHDWGMAVSSAEKECLLNRGLNAGFSILPEEPQIARKFISDAVSRGTLPDVAWADYVRQTHGLRGGVRIRKYLEPLGSTFADSVARVAEGHTLSLVEVRDPERYPIRFSVLGETVNLAALAAYVRIVDLLDIGDDRTPYALWKFVTPVNEFSRMEWAKHRALSPVSVRTDSSPRVVLIGGTTNDASVYAALGDLRSWIDDQFAASVAQLRAMQMHYDPGLDSRIVWDITTSGFEPISVRFEFDRPKVLTLLGKELYRRDPLAFLRELLQNSVDAIDARETLDLKHDAKLEGKIQIRIRSAKPHLIVEWSDNGIGMDEEVLRSYFAYLGRSWYLGQEASRIGEIEPISQFGVGILSCFGVSTSLSIETRKDPHSGAPRHGLSIEIPAQESHFRIERKEGLPVGTKIRLTVDRDSGRAITKESICSAITRISRFVRHSVVIDCDGETTFCGLSLGQSAIGDIYERLKISTRPLLVGAADGLNALTRTVGFEFRDPGDMLQGFFSNVIPLSPDLVGGSKTYNELSIGKAVIDLGKIAIDSEQVIFTKGVEAGPVGMWSSHSGSGFPELGWSDWIKPKILVNLKRPSALQFGLDRSTFMFGKDNWVGEMWGAIAYGLRTNVFNFPLNGPADTARLIGNCAFFGSIPDQGLDTLLDAGDTPLLILEPRLGPVWKFLKEISSRSHLLETPYELSYAREHFLDSPDVGSALSGWEGEDAIVSAYGFRSNSNDHPWVHTVVGFGHRTLIRQGWQPVELVLVRPSIDEKLPLACRVWRRDDRSVGEINPNEWPSRDEHWIEPNCKVLSCLYRDAPELLRFPKAAKGFAAFGSRYWDIENPKIAKIVSAFNALVHRRENGSLSTNSLRAISSVTSNSFYGYKDPSRKADVTLAIDVPNRLLDIAEEEGLNCSERLMRSDFYPGTVGKYEYAKWYRLDGWRIPGTGLGRFLD
jgi:hypothetical protein